MNDTELDTDQASKPIKSPTARAELSFREIKASLSGEPEFVQRTLVIVLILPFLAYLFSHIW
ncbi:hypothetical protein MACH17_29330 [Phaeobacter inhibens]|nr:hypothetical protein MACH17_29330 [Phaeobacter inhibens]